MRTERLQLIAATVDLCTAEMLGLEAVGRALDAEVPRSWPPRVFEPDDVERVRRPLASDARAKRWTLHYVLCTSPDGGARPTLVGVAGFVAPPGPDGAVEIGYAIAVEHQRRGYATEAVRALVAHAFSDPKVGVVVATTFASLLPSIGVLHKTRFQHVSTDPGSGVMRFERRRDQATAAR